MKTNNLRETAPSTLAVALPPSLQNQAIGSETSRESIQRYLKPVPFAGSVAPKRSGDEVPQSQESVSEETDSASCKAGQQKVKPIEQNLAEDRRMFAITPTGPKQFLITGGHTTPDYKDGTSVSDTAELLTILSDGSLKIETIEDRMTSPRWGHRATKLHNGMVFIAGGSASPDCDLYDPASRNFQTVSKLNDPRSGSEQILLPNGDILIVGGYDKKTGSGALASLELFHSKTNEISRAGSTTSPRVGHNLALFHGKVYIVGGADSRSTEIETWNPATSTVTQSGIKLPFPIKDFGFYQRGHMLYLVGGTDTSTGKSSDAIIKVDLRAGTVSTLTERLSEPREDISIIPSRRGHKLLAISGEIKNKGQPLDGSISEAVDSIDLKSGRVERLNLRIPRDDARTAPLGGHLFGPNRFLLIGGTQDKSGTFASNFLEITIK